ncbi:MAG: DUF4349 domain-containing protein [Chloroflexi bacterium]|nr:DUF4349 domain-containing protein [Chloroflexota bacterium]
MKKAILIAVVVVVVSLVVGCRASTASKTATSGGISVPTTAPAPSVREDFATSFSQGETGALPSTTADRMRVRTGDMSLVVQDVVDARDEVARLAIGFGGFVVSSFISGEEQDRRGFISIRVPDDKLEQTFVELRKMAVRVKSESTNSQDVTEEYTDLQARLANAQATESQYLAILQKAVTVEDTLKVYDALSRVRQEIEQIKGRMQLLERTSAMSLINVQLEPATTAAPLVRAGWNVVEVLKAAVRGLAVFGQWLGTIGIWALVFSPIWGIVLGIALWRWRKRKKI